MQPFLKWAGGKRWLFGEEFVSSLPSFERYIEPFLGGGAGFFAVRPKAAILSDVNGDLINLYRVIRDFPSDLADELRRHQSKHSKDYYYNVRDNKPLEQIAAAAWMLYLNRTCWNGLYRLNLAGKFNVPIGTKSSVLLPSDNFDALSELLTGIEINVSDFEGTVDQAGEGDLLFVDPPYTVKHNMNGFVKYNETIFRWADQVRLRDSLVRAKERGASVIVTNADHASIHELYKGFGKHGIVSRRSVISGKNEGRSSVTELMVRA
ncbi:DNA adenine methylase [Agrobacterium tumefaciens]|uniref:DNA adenine methylase n=1 Tax=Agrobacterium tumefaciens TaxID=358 RepID=UPI0021CE2FAE|nr:Dam family site-specific DNA-(adenine-N6)-methyltransferase [Agrobacterium tumefaciens]UXS00853.1 Dam family site-specific DNA-(adenine-N6)-methyltransferase [Agrobacterium tumefaciens]